MPAEAFVVVSTAPWDEIRSRSAGNAWLGFFGDPGWDDAKTRLEEAVFSHSHLSDEAALWSFDALAVLGAVHGSSAFFVSGLGKEPHFGLLLEPGEPRAAFDEQWTRLFERLPPGLELSAQRVGDLELSLLRGKGFGAGKEVAVLFDAGDLVGALVGTQAEALVGLACGIVGRRRGAEGTPGFAAHAGFLEARGRSATTPALRCFLDTDRLFETVQAVGRAQALAQGRVQDEKMLRVIEALGVTDVDWLYAEADVGPREQLDLTLRMDLPACSLLTDLMRFLGPLPVNMLSLMPEDSTSIGLSNYDLSSAFLTLKDFLAEWYPAAAEELEAGLASLADEFEIDLEKDVIDQLSGRFGTFEMPVPSEEIVDPFGFLTASTALSRGSAVILGLVEPDVVAGTIDHVIGILGAEDLMQVEEFQGSEIRTLGFGPFGVSWTFLERQLVVSMFPTALSAVLERAGQQGLPSAASNKNFGQALKSFGGEASIVSLADTRSTLEATLAALGVVQGLGGTAWAVAGQPAGAAVAFPFSDVLLPEPEIAGEYFEGTTTFVLALRGEFLEARFVAR